MSYVSARACGHRAVTLTRMTFKGWKPILKVYYVHKFKKK
jgi:hypothetical protein